MPAANTAQAQAPQGAKRKREKEIFDISGAPRKKVKGTKTRRVVLIKHSKFFAPLLDDNAAQDQQNSQDHSKKMRLLKKVVYFLHHTIEPEHVASLFSNIVPGTFDASWVAHVCNRDASKFQCEILTAVKSMVKAIIKANRQKPRHERHKLQKMSVDMRMRKVWKPPFLRNPVTFSLYMFKALAEVIDFWAIWETPDDTPGEVGQLVEKWRLFVLQNWVQAADGAYRQWYLPKKYPEHPEVLKGKKENSYTLWKDTTLSLEPPDIQDVPINPSDGFQNEQSLTITDEEDKFGG